MTIRVGVLGVVFLLLMCSSAVCDVLFTHEIQSDDYMLGKIDTRMRIGYTDQIKYMDKETRYKASLLKRFFGKVKVGRSTSEFNLKENTVSEVDWENEYIYTYPLASISDPDWHLKRTPFVKEREDFIKDRYEVSPPKISFEFKQDPEIIAGYSTRRVDIEVNLQTIDKKKDAQSLTRITQSLWLTDGVEGYGLYTKFNKDLSSKTGVNQYRLGLLGDLLSNLPQDLTFIENDLSRIKGYAVKSHFHIEGSYVQNFKDKPARTSTKVLKDETMILKEVLKTDTLDSSLFLPPASFSPKIIN